MASISFLALHVSCPALPLDDFSVTHSLFINIINSVGAESTPSLYFDVDASEESCEAEENHP